MADTAPNTDEQDQYSENEIAVHWREEATVAPPPDFARHANANDPGIIERFAEDNFPQCFEEYADLLSWDRKWDTILDDSNPPFFKWWVGGRLERVRQLRRPAPRNARRQQRLHLGPGARERRARADHLQRPLPPRQRVRSASSGLRRRQPRGPGHLPSADGPRAAGVDARLCPTWGHPFGGLRRLQRRGLRATHGRCAKHGPRHDGRLLPQRRTRRPQDQGRRGNRGGPQGTASRSRRCWSGDGTPANTTRKARWSRAATSS